MIDGEGHARDEHDDGHNFLERVHESVAASRHAEEAEEKPHILCPNCGGESEKIRRTRDDPTPMLDKEERECLECRFVFAESEGLQGVEAPIP